MGHVLKQIDLDNGVQYKETGCGNYICKYCGGKATSVNYVMNMCLQVYAKHIGLCGAYVENEKYMGYVTDCTTCAYQEDGNCTFEGVDKL